MTASHNYFPVYLDLAGRQCLVVGGGEVAVSRIESFLHAGAEVTVIAENAHDRIQSWAENGRVRWLRRRVRASDTDGAFLVVITTDEKTEKSEVCSRCRMSRQLVNSHDDATNSNFIYPAVARSGPIQVAVTSSGKSPAMAQRLRDRIKRDLLTDSLGQLADFLGSKRPLVIKSLPTYQVRKQFWSAVLESSLPDLLKENDGAAEARFNELLASFKNQKASAREEPIQV